MELLKRKFRRTGMAFKGEERLAGKFVTLSVTGEWEGSHEISASVNVDGAERRLEAGGRRLEAGGWGPGASGRGDWE